MTLFIVEDEPLFAGRLEMLIEKLGYQMAGIADNSHDALHLIRENPPDLLLMDVHIQGEHDGIELAEIIRKDYSIPVIFITSLEDELTFKRASRSYPVQFLTKPVSDIQLQRSIELAVKNLAGRPPTHTETEMWEKDVLFLDHLFIKVRHKLEKVAIQNILYVAADGRYAQIITQGKKYLVRIPLKELAAMLPADQFRPTHRSFVVNTRKIQTIDLQENLVQIQEHQIPLSKRQKEDFLKKLDWI
ncbi:MAG: response regulator [Haliscomenobacter sp.]|nr:response regulator [Haliscomenobacter sp.]MBK7477315.1 response regulator [Haliscomenobacter sp.]